MRRTSTRSWIEGLALAVGVLAFAACSQGSDSSELVVDSVSVTDFGSWQANRPIEFSFNQRIDFGSVSAQSIRIRTSTGVPAVGAFAAKAFDTNGDGVPERTDESTVVFYPSCPATDDASDAGL